MRNYLIAVLAGSLIPFISYASVEISDGSVIGLYHFNDDSVDASGNGNNGTDTNMTYGTGILSNAGQFNGTSAYITFSDKITPLGEKSLTFWVKSDYTGGTQAVYNNNALDSSESGVEVYINTTSGYITWGLTYGAGGGLRRWSQTSDINIADNAWHHIVLTWDGTTGTNAVKMYIDGELNKENTATGTESNAPTDNLRMGDNSAGVHLYFDGSLDELAILDKELVQADINSLYNTGLGDTICVSVGCGATATSTIKTSVLEHSYTLLILGVFGVAFWLGTRLL